jgi:hypothetical protein
MIILRMRLLQILLIASMSCREKKNPIDFLKKINYEIFFGVTIEARKEDSGRYVAYKFAKEFGDEKFVLPNYKYYNNDQIENDTLFDILKYGNANGLKDFSDANNAARIYADSVVNEFEKTRAYKVFSSQKQGHFIIFYLNPTDFIAYVPDKSKVYNDFWKSRLINSKQLEAHWFSGKCLSTRLTN